MVAKTGYEAYRRSAESTSRDQTGELQPMEQVGTHAPALFAAKAGSTERADYTLSGIAELYEKQEKVAVPTGSSFFSSSESFMNATVFSSGTETVPGSEPKPPRWGTSGGELADIALVREGCLSLTSLLTAPTLPAAAASATAAKAETTTDTACVSASGCGQLRVWPISMFEGRCDPSLAKELIELTSRSSNLTICPISMWTAPLESTSTMDQFLNHKLSHHAYDLSHNAITQYFLNVLPPIGFFTSEGGKCCTNSHQLLATRAYDMPLRSAVPSIYTHTELGSDSTYPSSSYVSSTEITDSSGVEQHDMDGGEQQQSGDKSSSVDTSAPSSSGPAAASDHGNSNPSSAAGGKRNEPDGHEDDDGDGPPEKKGRAVKSGARAVAAVCLPRGLAARPAPGRATAQADLSRLLPGAGSTV